MMHPKVVEAIQQIDAAVFSGDTFYDPKAREELLAYAASWVKQMLTERVWEGAPPDDVEFQQRQTAEDAIRAKVDELVKP